MNHIPTEPDESTSIIVYTARGSFKLMFDDFNTKSVSFRAIPQPDYKYSTKTRNLKRQLYQHSRPTSYFIFLGVKIEINQISHSNF